MTRAMFRKRGANSTFQFDRSEEAAQTWKRKYNVAEQRKVRRLRYTLLLNFRLAMIMRNSSNPTYRYW